MIYMQQQISGFMRKNLYLQIKSSHLGFIFCPSLPVRIQFLTIYIMGEKAWNKRA